MPPKDRLAELQKGQKGKITSLPEVTILIREDAVEKFLEKVENVSQSIDLVESKIKAIKEIHSSILNSHSDSHQEKEEQERVMKQITQIATNIRNDMQGLQKEADKPGLSNFTFRMRKTHHSSLARRLVNVMDVYNTEQADYRQKCKARMKRQLAIVDPDGKPKTDEEMENLLESKNLQIFSQGILANSEKAKEALADVEARHQDILALERNIIQIKELFFEVANLVDAQNDTIDRLENNIELGVNKLNDAKDQMGDALIKQKKARKLKVCLLITVLVLLAILVIGLAVQFG
ncbi:putative Syntaxin [Hypsibius exemplaris]|uniref:Syntaxin n=1 Tax=Hypsibius exemplaris TaxID=2072580 RepID=A0A1W0WRZ3_HYPEX|nr:putative Syntaxin [Hypsibius exemplaris]